MYPPTVISLSGAALSVLLYESSNTNFQQIGFLLGEIIHKETSTITDSEHEEVRVVKIVNIHSIIPCFSKYFENGRVDTIKVKKFLSDRFSEVVGWYKFKCTDPSLFLKTRLIHKQLKDMFNVPSELFTFCSMFLECAENNSTYRFLQSFVRYNNGFINRIPITVPNLGDDNHKLFEPTSKVFNNILSNMKTEVKSSKGLLAVSQLDHVVQAHTSETVKKLKEYEKELFNLEEEVNLLKHIKNNSIHLGVVTTAESEIKENNNEVMDVDMNGSMEYKYRPDGDDGNNRLGSGEKENQETNESEDSISKKASEAGMNVPSIKKSVSCDIEPQSEQSTGPKAGRNRGKKPKK